MKRRTVIVACIVIACIAAASAQRAIVIGAGAAGLAAAAQLVSRGWDVTILEARNRTGGRVWTATRRLAGISQPVVLDYGAMWIQGSSKPTNPVYQLAVAAKLRVWSSNQDTGATYWPRGRETTSAEDRAATKQVDDLLAWVGAQQSDQLDCDRNPDRQLALQTLVNRYVKEEDIRTTNILNNSLNSRIVQEYAASLRNLSACFWDAEGGRGGARSSWLGSSGFGGVTDQLIKAAKLAGRIRLQQTVTAIDYSEATLRAHGGNVVVRVKGPGGVGLYQAQRVLVTVPLGILKNNNITFTPALPADKQGAIQRLGMGVLDKVFLVFKRPFWDTSVFWLNRIAPEGQVGQWTEFVSPYMYTKQPMLIAFIAGDQALAAERQPSLNATVQQVLDALNTMYPGKVPALENLVYYDRYFWGKDPFTYGSYSFVARGATPMDRAVLAKPLSTRGFGARLFFAGEATHSKYPSTVHGAIASGRDAASAMEAA